MTEPGPLLPPGANATGALATFAGSGGRKLSYRSVGPEDCRHLALYLHGIESHGTWFLPVAQKLALRHAVRTILMDRRGSGLNRDIEPGDARSANELLADVRLLRSALGNPKLHIIGLSWGGKLATATVIDQPDSIESLVLITPGLKARVDLPLWDKLRLIGGLLTGGRSRFKVPIEPEMFTRTPEFLEFIKTDPWRLREVTGRFLLSGISLDRRIRRGLRTFPVNVLLFLAGNEWIIDNDRVLKLLGNLPPGRMTSRLYDDATHSIQFESSDRLVRDLGAHFEGRTIPC